MPQPPGYPVYLLAVQEASGGHPRRHRRGDWRAALPQEGITLSHSLFTTTLLQYFAYLTSLLYLLYSITELTLLHYFTNFTSLPYFTTVAIVTLLHRRAALPQEGTSPSRVVFSVVPYRFYQFRPGNSGIGLVSFVPIAYQRGS